MINYLISEWYQLKLRKGTYIWLLLSLATGIGCVLLMKYAFTAEGSARTYIYGLSQLYVASFVTQFLIGHFVFNQEYRHRTLINTLSFGVKRWQVYVVKIITAAIFWMLCVGVTVLGALVTIQLIGHDVWSELSLLWSNFLVIHAPFWLMNITLVMSLLLTFDSSLVLPILYILWIFSGDLLAATQVQTLVKIAEYLPSELISPSSFMTVEVGVNADVESGIQAVDPNQIEVSWQMIKHAPLIATGYTMLSSVVSVFMFNRREVK